MEEYRPYIERIKKFSIIRNIKEKLLERDVILASLLVDGSNKGDSIVIDQFGAIKNIDEAISIIGSTTNTEYKDAGIAGGVGLTIEGDNTNQSIKVSVTGDASDDIIWSVFLNVFTTGYKQPYSIIYEDGNNIITEASDNLTTQINI